MPILELPRDKHIFEIHLQLSLFSQAGYRDVEPGILYKGGATYQHASHLESS